MVTIYDRIEYRMVESHTNGQYRVFSFSPVISGCCWPFSVEILVRSNSNLLLIIPLINTPLEQNRTPTNTDLRFARMQRTFRTAVGHARKSLFYRLDQFLSPIVSTNFDGGDCSCAPPQWQPVSCFMGAVHEYWPKYSVHGSKLHR